jgi:hypothetical protein
MRVNEICSRPDYRGPYPGSRGKWWAEVAAGRIPPPKKFGPRISTWHREVVAEVTGIGQLGKRGLASTEQRTICPSNVQRVEKQIEGHTS